MKRKTIEIILFVILIPGLFLGGVIIGIELHTRHIERQFPFEKNELNPLEEIKQHFYQYPPNLSVSLDNVTLTVDPDPAFDQGFELFPNISYWVIFPEEILTVINCTMTWHPKIYVLDFDFVNASLKFTDNNTYDQTLIYWHFEHRNEQPHWNFIFALSTCEILEKIL